MHYSCCPLSVYSVVTTFCAMRFICPLSLLCPFRPSRFSLVCRPFTFVHLKTYVVEHLFRLIGKPYLSSPVCCILLFVLYPNFAGYMYIHSLDSCTCI